MIPGFAIAAIQREVASYYGLSVPELVSRNRRPARVRARQVAMALSRQLTPMSIPVIGQRFGGRDHSTVHHALRRVEQLCVKDSALRGDVETLAKRLAG